MNKVKVRISLVSVRTRVRFNFRVRVVFSCIVVAWSDRRDFRAKMLQSLVKIV
jgi:hypothetical protein